MAQRISFLHGALVFPELSTLYDALDEGFLTSLPEITSKFVRKYPPPSATMVQGHLYQTGRNVGSTQQSPAGASKYDLRPTIRIFLSCTTMTLTTSMLSQCQVVRDTESC